MLATHRWTRTDTSEGLHPHRCSCCKTSPSLPRRERSRGCCGRWVRRGSRTGLRLGGRFRRIAACSPDGWQQACSQVIGHAAPPWWSRGQGPRRFDGAIPGRWPHHRKPCAQRLLEPRSDGGPWKLTRCRQWFAEPARFVRMLKGWWRSGRVGDFWPRLAPWSARQCRSFPRVRHLKEEVAWLQHRQRGTNCRQPRESAHSQDGGVRSHRPLGAGVRATDRESQGEGILRGHQRFLDAVSGQKPSEPQGLLPSRCGRFRRLKRVQIQGQQAPSRSQQFQFCPTR